MEAPDVRVGNQFTTGFSRVFVSDEKMTFSGGPQNRTQVQTISIHRTPEGDIYLDDKGSELTRWEPENGVIEVKNVLGFKIMWKKPGQGFDSPMTNEPSANGF